MNNRELLQEQATASKLSGIAAIIASIPRVAVYWIIGILTIILVSFVWLFFTWLTLVLTILFWMLTILIASAIVRYYAKVGYSAYKAVHDASMMNIEKQRAIEALNKARLANQREEERLTFDRMLKPMVVEAVATGKNFSYTAKGDLHLTDWRSNIHMIQPGTEAKQIEAPVTPLPTNVRYEEVRPHIPEGHNLVGIGPNGIVTKEDRKIGACVWIVGLSGTGKTSTTSLRIEERAACGHQFLGHDPHWFKDDSLTNAIVGYSDRFLMPMARSNDEALLVYDAFLTEFNNRKAGKVPKPFQKITIVVDEVNSLAEPEDEDEDGKKLLDKLKTIVRICGTEARNFNMGGLFISQKATRLYWIRDVALLIIVHKLLMENQQKLATNCDDKTFFAEMRLWPVGRTYVYGAGLEAGEGCITVQQPYFEKAPVGSWNFEDRVIVEEEPVVNDLDIVYEACQQIKEQGMKVTVRSVAELVPFGKTKVSELMNKLETQGCKIS